VSLPVIGLDEIRTAAAPQRILDSVREALIAHAEGRTQVPPPTHLNFPDAGGDCHVKTGFVAGSPYFTVKVASGFYANRQIGLPTNSGVILALSATTGEPIAVLVDEGWITAWRTAAAGALITDALAPPEIEQVGVLGTGLQARLQAEWLHTLRPLNRVKVWGRSHSAAEQLAEDLAAIGIDARVATLEAAAAEPCVITATASTTPLAPARAFGNTRHITAVGADMPGKSELPPALFARASTIATDDHTQCLEHGDFGVAVRAGYVNAKADTPVGIILRDHPHRTSAGDSRASFSIADLTGVGATDTAVVSAILSALNPIR
jgi:ornithine cyclodeaminase